MTHPPGLHVHTYEAEGAMRYAVTLTLASGETLWLDCALDSDESARARLDEIRESIE